MKILSTLTIAAALAFAGGAASALPLIPSSYDMANGNGVATGGSFNYWDLAYTGAGATSVDNAPLTGGLGDLTDGVIAADNWLAVENGAGTGPYVGWRAAFQPNPVITFRFSPGPLETFFFNSVTLHLDDSDGAGGVHPPSSIDTAVGADPFASTAVGDQPGPAPFSVTIPLGAIAGDTVTIRLNNLNEWIFLSEVQFEGDIVIRDDFGVPEPASLALLGLAVAGLGVARRPRAA